MGLQRASLIASFSLYLYWSSIRGLGNLSIVNHAQSHQSHLPGILSAAACVVDTAGNYVRVTDCFNLEEHERKL